MAKKNKYTIHIVRFTTTGVCDDRTVRYGSVRNDYAIISKSGGDISGKIEEYRLQEHIAMQAANGDTEVKTTAKVIKAYPVVDLLRG